MRFPLPNRSYASILLALFAVFFAILALSPTDRQDWALENTLAIILVGYLILTYRSFPLSRISYTLIFVFLCLHEIGAHYTYAEVPYDAFFKSVFGTTVNDLMGWQRNHFDRLVHFSYGLLLSYPIREIFHRVVNVKGFWGYFLPLDVTMSTSMVFELFEWAAVMLVGGDLGMAYLGTQGDVWDAHKDMGLATCGAIITMTVTAIINYYIQRDFAVEWNQSFKVKGQKPLGEDEISRLLLEKKRAIKKARRKEEMN
jgi:putative membrane protein